ncbi:hypothetical protein P4193_23805 [Pseudomonas aeruginosa]|nr:hypothetical protein [Pseudomonas aeruginosa]
MEGLKFYARLLWRPPRETLLFALRTVAAGLLTWPWPSSSTWSNRSGR